MKASTFRKFAIAAWVLTLAGAAQAQCFGKQIQHIGGRLEPWQIVAADFNHDGFPDLAVGTLNSGNPSWRGKVSIFLGDGKGTFIRPGLHYYEAFGLEDLAVGDFNNDGNLDIIDVNWDFYNLPQGVGILLGNGDGTFTRHTHRELPWKLDHVVVGDFNGDGNLDAVVWSTQTYFFGVYLGNGDGTLRGPFHFPTGGLYPPFQILSADFNGDGISDVAFGNFTRSGTRVEVLLGQSDGTFHAGSVNQITTRNMTGLLQGDFNEDGFPDLAVSTSLPAGIDIFLGNGDGSFQPAVHYPSHLAFKFITADFNGDGHLDLLSTLDAFGFGDRGEWSIVIGNGDGTFQSPVEHTNLTKPVWAIAAADFNQDGYADLAITDTEDVAIFPNLGKCP
jgi:hypothetical protein